MNGSSSSGASSDGLAEQNSSIKLMKTKAHPGFQSVQKSISKRQGIPMANAGAILASATRKAQGLASNSKIPKRRK